MTQTLGPVETSLAIYRGFEWLQNHRNVSIDSGSRYHLRSVLPNRMTSIHQYLFKDTHAVATSAMPQAGHLERKKAAELVEVFKPLLSSFFDPHGFQRKSQDGLLALPRDDVQITPETRALLKQQGKKPEAALANFMADFLALKPYPYGNWMTLTTFLVEFCRGDKMKDVFHGNGFDLRRVDEEILNAIKEQTSSLGSHAEVPDSLRQLCIKLVEQATGNTIRQENGHSGQEQEQYWPKFPSTSYEVGGKRFLTYSKDGERFFVTVNGALIPVKSIEADLRNHLNKPDSKESHPAEYMVTFKKADWIQDEAAFETAKEKSKFHQNVDDFDWKNAKNVDGFPVKCKGHGKELTYTAPLVCLDIDIMTGLELITQLPELVSHLKQKGLTVKDLVDKKKFEIATHNEDKDMVQRMERARDQLERTMPLVGKIVKHKLGDKEPAHGTPKFFMPLGGSGAGKGRTKQVAQDAADTKVVINSLDGNRYYSHIMKLIVACGHHSDDYAMVRSFATAIRDRVEEESLKQKFNIYYDASGVNYEGRYDALLAKFKKAGFETYVYAALAPLAYRTPEPGKLAVWQRVMARADYKSRAVPWPIVLEKHIQEAASLFAAARDKNVDHLTVFDTSPEREKITNETGEIITKKPDALAKVEITAQLPDADEQGKSAFVVGRDNGHYRVLRVLDKHHVPLFSDLMTKCLLDPNASGPKALYSSRFSQATLDGVIQAWAGREGAANTPERTL